MKKSFFHEPYHGIANESKNESSNENKNNHNHNEFFSKVKISFSQDELNEIARMNGNYLYTILEGQRQAIKKLEDIESLLRTLVELKQHEVLISQHVNHWHLPVKINGIENESQR